jgi:hypothetical protein
MAEQTVTALPTVTITPEGKFRLEGGTTAQGWYRGNPPWCEMKVSFSTGQVYSYGGEVWPMAWPWLFSSDDERAGRVYLKTEGRELLMEALIRYWDVKNGF